MYVNKRVELPNKPPRFCGRKATLKLNSDTQSSGAVCESRGGRPRLPVPNSSFFLFLGVRGGPETTRLMVLIKLVVCNSLES